MRDKKAFLSCAVVAAAVGLLAATTVMATGDDDSTCINPTTPIVKVISPHPEVPETDEVKGPCPVSSLSSPVCTGQGPYTGIQYQITLTGLTDVATLVTANNTVANSTPQPACKGDSKTGLGKNSCHELAVKPIVDTGKKFWVIVLGTKQPIDTTVAGKKVSKVYCSRVAGLGLDTNPFQAVKKTEVQKFKECSLKIEYDAATGQVLGDPALTDDSVIAGCTLTSSDVGQLELKLNGTSIGTGKVGDGFFSTGEQSCTTIIRQGRAFTFGNPCP